MRYTACQSVKKGIGISSDLRGRGANAAFSGNDFYNYMGRARGALVEVETQLLIAQNLGYLGTDHAQTLLNKAAEVGKILNGLVASIRPAA